jgi:hypothetical protein
LISDALNPDVRKWATPNFHDMLKTLSLLIISLTAIGYAKEKGEIDFVPLIAQADRYQLPKPAADARLVLGATGWTTVIGSSSSDLDPSVYEPGFILHENADGSASVMLGFTESHCERRREHEPAILPFIAKPPKLKLGGYAFRGNSLTTFSTAIQCARLGDLSNANALARLYLHAEYQDGFFTQEDTRPYQKNLPLLLARITYGFYYQRVREKDADLKQALAMLERLKAEFPDLFSDKPDLYNSYSRTAFLSDLAFTVASPPAEKDSIEDLLFQTAASDVPTHMRESDHPVYKIYLQGTSSIPELVRLSTSRKLSAAVQSGIMNSSERRLRLGDIASTVLGDMVGTHAPERQTGEVWQTWIKTMDLSDEKSFFIKALEAKNGEQSFNAGVPLTILIHKYPESALRLAEKFSGTDHRTQFVTVLMDSTLEKATKINCLQVLYQDQRGLKRRYLLQCLAKIDPTAVVKEILPLIEQLPEDVSTPYWTCEEANLTHVVMQLNEPVVWKAFLVKARTSSVGLRMELMNPMNYTYVGETNRDFRLAFLATFLGDAASRTVKNSDPRWDGPHAGFTFDTLSVRNFAAMKIGSILKVPGDPADYWKENQWSSYRKQVALALDKITLPDIKK